MLKKNAYRLAKSFAGPLVNKYKHQIFFDLAHHLGVSKMTIKGKYGDISGLLADQFIFTFYARHGVWAENINNVFLQFFNDRPGGTFLDLGANIGLTAIAVAQRGTLTHAVEAEPVNFGLLSENMARNVRPDSFRLYNVALYSEPTELKFDIDPVNYGRHHVAHAGKGWETSKTIAVKGDRLDAIIPAASLKGPLAIKMDVEGCEWHAFTGGRSVFQKSDLLLTEFWPKAITELGGNPGALVDMLAQDFQRGRVLASQEAFTKNWRPIADVAAELRALIGTDEHVDVVLGK